MVVCLYAEFRPQSHKTTYNYIAVSVYPKFGTDIKMNIELFCLPTV